MNGYYHIPISKSYSLIISGKAFYDFSKERNPDKKILGNYSIVFGVEIPKSPFQAIFKYIDGKRYEGIGFPPDVNVPFSAAAIAVGDDPQLDSAINRIH